MSDYRGREMHKAVCAECGKECEVPFQPHPSRPVYRRDCYAKHRRQGDYRPRYTSDEQTKNMWAQNRE